jgi:hypothetical protein
MTTLAALVLELRILAKDKDDSNYILDEELKAVGGGGANGSKTKFRLQRQNIVGTSTTVHSVYLSQNSTIRTQSGFTVDLTNGILTMSAAPAAADSPLSVDYNFYWFPDASYNEFLTDAGRALKFTDVTTTPDGLLPALLNYGLYYFYIARATEYAHKYASSGGQAGQSVETVTGNFRALAKLAKADAEKFRDDYYKGAGARQAPASHFINYGIDPGSPRR